MNVLLYSHSFAPSVGGVETYVMSLAKGLSKHSLQTRPQIQVSVVTQTPGSEMDDDALPFPIVRRPSLWALAKLIRRFDVVHIAGPALPPMILAALLRKPIVIEHSGYQSVCPNGMLLQGPERRLCPGYFMAGDYRKCVGCNAHEWGQIRSLKKLLLTFPRRLLCQHVNQNVAPSQHIAMRSLLPRTSVIYHGVPPQDPDPAEVGGRSDRVSFLYVGRLVIEKGVSVLLKAAHQLTDSAWDFHIDIIGDGPERDNLERLAQELLLGDRVTFHGSMHPAKIAETIERPAAVVMPSIWEDVAPLVAIEQMMLGRLVIASDIGGLGELLGDAGFKFRAGDWADLAECMREILQNPTLIANKRQAARARGLALFQEDRMVMEHAEIYLDLAKCSGPRDKAPRLNQPV